MNRTKSPSSSITNDVTLSFGKNRKRLPIVNFQIPRNAKISGAETRYFRENIIRQRRGPDGDNKRWKSKQEPLQPLPDLITLLHQIRTRSSDLAFFSFPPFARTFIRLRSIDKWQNFLPNVCVCVCKTIT